MYLYTQQGGEGQIKNKKILRSVLTIAVILVAAALVYSYFTIRGDDIDGLELLLEGGSVTASKYEISEYEDKTEYELPPELAGQLYELIEKTSFTRVLANMVTGFDPDEMYDIIIRGEKDTLSLHVVVGEYLLVTNQFDGKHLRIRGDDFMPALKDILERARQIG